MTDDIQSLEVSGYLCTCTSAGASSIVTEKNPSQLYSPPINVFFFSKILFMSSTSLRGRRVIFTILARCCSGSGNLGLMSTFTRLHTDSSGSPCCLLRSLSFALGTLLAKTGKREEWEGSGAGSSVETGTKRLRRSAESYF